MIANLHLHSCFSDGMSWPEDIALDAARSGLDLVALTDHDTMAGVARFCAACTSRGIQAIPACEIDVNEPQIDYKSELLAYFPGAEPAVGAPATRAILRESLRNRRARLEFLINSARELYPDKKLSFEELFRDKTKMEYDSALADEISWSKVDLFLYLKASRCIEPDMNYKAFKKKFFANGLLQKYKLDKPDIASVVAAVHADNGFVVLPHFGHLWDDDASLMYKETEKLRSKLAWFRRAGVDGVELYWYNTDYRSAKINELVRTVAKPQGFFFTYGSDCHGPGSGKHTITKFKGNFEGFPVRQAIGQTSEGHQGGAGHVSPNTAG
jgi:hypothetical protein